VPGAEIVDKKEEILDAMIKPGFDPALVVLFEKGTRQLKLLPPGKDLPADPGNVTIVSYQPDSIALSVHARSAALLFLSEVFYPGWKAYVDGQPTEILRGNYLFRVLEVPEGRHEVHLVFDPWTIKAGKGITLLTVLLILALAIFHRRKSRASPAHRPPSFPVL